VERGRCRRGLKGHTAGEGKASATGGMRGGKLQKKERLHTLSGEVRRERKTHTPQGASLWIQRRPVLYKTVGVVKSTQRKSSETDACHTVSNKPDFLPTKEGKTDTRGGGTKPVDNIPKNPLHLGAGGKGAIEIRIHFD